MKPENWIALAGVILSALLTGIGLYFGPKLAVKRALEQFRSEKWWERKEQIYTTLLEQLSLIFHHHSKLLHAEQMGETFTLSDKDREGVEQARQHLKKSLELGQYLISTKAADALNKALWANGDCAMEYYDDSCTKLANAIELIKKEAISEVPPHKTSR
jgi:hypothetical protein